MKRPFALVWFIGTLAMSALALALPVPVGRLGTTLHAGLDPRDPMPTERSDSGRTGRLRGSLPRAETRVAFDVALEAAHPRGPIIDRDGRIYVGTAHGLVCVSAMGELLLDLRLGPIDAAPVILPSGDVLALTRDLQLSVFHPSGEVVVSTTLAAAVRAAPLVLDDGSVVLAAVDRRVTHLGSDLIEHSVVTLDEGPVTAPTLALSGRIALSGGSTLYIVDLSSGSIVRRIALGARAIGAAVRGETGELFQLLNDGTIVRVDHEADVGLRISLHPEGEAGRVFDANAIALAPDGSLLVTLPTRGVVSVDTTGTVRWTYTTDAPFYGPVAVDREGYAIATDRRGRLSVLDPAGHLVYRVELGVPIAVPAISGRTLVVATDRPSIMGFEIP